LNILENIYRNSPFWIKNIIMSIYGIKEYIKNHGKYYDLHYKELKGILNFDESALKDLQEKKLKKLLTENLIYSPYYRKNFLALGITENSIENENVLELLQTLPFLTKEILREQITEIVSVNPIRKKYCTTKTSGTTGTPMTIEFDSESRQSTFAEWRRYYDWLGLPNKFRSVRFSGRIIVSPETSEPPFWAYNMINNQLFMSTYHLLEVNIKSYLKKLNDFKPVFMDGYPSSFYIMAQYIQANNIKLNFKLMAISTTAETLLEHHRKTIEDAFKCKVYNQYASSEGAPWIVECKVGHYHLWTDTGVFEFFNQKDNNDGTIISEMVVTSFRNLKTPLIRYKIGDFVRSYKEEKKCSCGSNYPIIHSVIGREDDMLYTQERGYIGRLDPVYKGLSGIIQSMIIQTDINYVKVLIIPDKDYEDSTGDKLLKNLHDRLGSNIQIKLIKTDHIPLGKNGKFKSVVRQFNILLEENN